MKGIRSETVTMSTDPDAQLNFERQISEGVNYNIDEKIIKPFRLVGFDPNYALVSEDADDEFISNVIAAAVAAAHGMPLKHVLKALDKEISGFSSSASSDDDLKYETYRIGKTLMLRCMSEWDRENVDGRPAGEAYSDVALIHLFSTFDSIGVLIKLKHLHESLSLCRDFLEQLAFSYSISKVESFEDGIEIKPPKAIGELKTIIPESGMLYGLLCDSVHLRIDNHLTFLQEDGMVNLTHPRETLYLSLLLLKLAQFWCIVYEYTQRDAMQSFTWWKASGDRLQRTEYKDFQELYETLREEAIGDAADISKTAPYIETVETSLLKIFAYLGIPVEPEEEQDDQFSTFF